MTEIGDETEAVRPRTPGRRTLALIIAPIAVLTVCSYVADGLTTSWAEQHPLALMLLNSRNRILILVTNQVDVVTFYVAGTFRLLLTDPLYFVVGALYGEAALTWAHSKSKTVSRYLAWVERNFDKAAWPFIIIAPNPIVSLLAGRSKMRFSLFLALNLFGTIGRLYLIRWLGSALQDPIDAVLRFFARYRLPLLAISAGLVGINLALDRRKKRGELADLRSLEDTLEPPLADGS